MSRPHFLADEDLSGALVAAVRRLAPDLAITTVVEQGRSSATDEEVLELAWQQQWLVVSHDVNTLRAFAEQRIADGRGIHGLFLVPQSRAIRQSAECLRLIWEASEFEEWRNRVVFLPF